MLAFPERAVKKGLTSLEKRWHLLKDLLKSICQLRNVLAFAEEAVKQVFANLDMFSHSQLELLKKCWQA